MSDDLPPPPYPGPPPEQPHEPPPVPPSAPPPPPTYAAPVYVAKADNATAAMVTGIIAIAGGFMCLIPLVASPIAWVLGQKALNAIKQNPALQGRGEAQAGLILGIVGTVLLALALVGIILMITLFATAPAEFWEE